MPSWRETDCTVGTMPRPRRSGSCDCGLSACRCPRRLTINTKVRLVPNDNRDNENAPVFRVFVGQSRIGDAWAARSGGDSPKDYLRIRLDDASLPEPISAALFQSEDGNQVQLAWKPAEGGGGYKVGSLS